jgi:hypothetical protein
MASITKFDMDGVARMPVQERKTTIVPALENLAEAIRCVCPPEAVVGFRFDGKLFVDIDVRSVEHAILVESFLPTLQAGAFRDIRRGKSPSAFLHRITAQVDC